MRQARPKEEHEWDVWERERRRVLLMQYARSAVQIVALICGTVFLIWLLIALANEGV